MGLGEAILAVGAGERAASFELFSETLDAEWIAQGLWAGSGGRPCPAVDTRALARLHLPETSATERPSSGVM